MSGNPSPNLSGQALGGSANATQAAVPVVRDNASANSGGGGVSGLGVVAIIIGFGSYLLSVYVQYVITKGLSYSCSSACVEDPAAYGVMRKMFPPGNNLFRGRKFIFAMSVVSLIVLAVAPIIGVVWVLARPNARM